MLLREVLIMKFIAKLWNRSPCRVTVSLYFLTAAQ